MENFFNNLYTPLIYKPKLSIKYKSNIFFKHENISLYNSYKTRLINYFFKLKNNITIVCYPIHIECFYQIVNNLNVNIVIFTLKNSYF